MTNGQIINIHLVNLLERFLIVQEPDQIFLVFELLHSLNSTLKGSNDTTLRLTPNCAHPSSFTVSDRRIEWTEGRCFNLACI